MTLRVSEIFGPTLQGEGPVIGRPTVFVRLFGCDYRCSWCDSLHAVLPQYRDTSKPMEIIGILGEVGILTGDRPILITLSGGNPALFDLLPLIKAGHDMGYTFALETQGSVARPWFSRLDYLTLSPKPPSSGEHTLEAQVQACIDAAGALSYFDPRAGTVAIKVVVFDERDLDYALGMHAAFSLIPFYLQVGNPEVGTGMSDFAASQHQLMLLDKLGDLAQEVMARKVYDVHILPQLHTLIWGNARAR